MIYSGRVDELCTCTRQMVEGLDAVVHCVRGVNARFHDHDKQIKVVTGKSEAKARSASVVLKPY